MDPRAALELLATEARQTARDLSRQLDEVVAASEASNADDEHDPEGATIAFERAQLSELLDGTRSRLAAISAALARVDAGSYGSCVRCGTAIGAERLEARPFTTVCVACAAARR